MTVIVTILAYKKKIQNGVDCRRYEKRSKAHRIQEVLREEPNWQQLSDFFVFVSLVALNKRILSKICIVLFYLIKNRSV